MPAVPEVFNVFADKRLIKVFRRFDTHDIAYTDGKHRVTRKIKKQVQAVSVHVQHITPQFAVGDMNRFIMKYVLIAYPIMNLYKKPIKIL